MTVFNTLGENLSLAPSYAANPAIHSWAEYDYFCGGYNQMAMVGYALFQGYYSQENFSLAGHPCSSPPSLSCRAPPGLTPPQSCSCPTTTPRRSTGQEGARSWNRSSIPATTESCYTNGGTYCGVGTGLFGYWNTSAPLSFQQAAVGSPFFRYLPLGEYTLAVQDVWNQTVYAHFEVISLPRAECPSAQTPTPEFGTVTVGSSSPAIICVQFYYYPSDSFTQLTLNLTDPFSISAPTVVPSGSLENTPWVDWGSNFTVTASQSQLVLGGRRIVNEGATVAFAVTAKPGTSGTFFLGFLPSAIVLGSYEPQNCNYYGLLVAGSGLPKLGDTPLCITYAMTSLSASTGTTGSSSIFTLPGIPYPLLSGDVYFRIVGVTNSTG